MVPFAIIDLLIDGPGLRGARAHVQQQVQVAVQHFDSKEVHLESLGPTGLFAGLGPAVAKEQQPIGFCGAEIEGYGTGPTGCPGAQSHEGLWRLESHGIQSGYALALEGYCPVNLHFGVPQLR